MALTLKTVNRHLKSLGVREELVKGEGYFYFSGGTAHKWYTTIVYVWRINDLTLEQWVESYYGLLQNAVVDLQCNIV